MSATRHPLLLHGFTGSSASWGDRLIDGLAGGRLPPVLVDLPGHGREAGTVDPAAFTLDAALDLVSAAGAWPTDVVGYSMGARLALHYAAEHPERVRRLVLESGSPGLQGEQERVARRAEDEAMAGRLLNEGIEAFVDSWEALPLFETRRRLDPGLMAHHRALRLRNDARSLAAAVVGLGTGTLPSLWERLPTLTAPTLLLVGALDPKFVDIADRMAAAMPDARVVVVPDAGHTVHLERPAAWLEAVVGFLG